jgi:hypothetical protein
MKKLKSMNLNTKIIIRDSNEKQKKDLFVAFAEVTPLYCSKAGKIASLKYGYMLSNDYYIFRTWYNKNIRSGCFVFFNELEYQIERVVNLSNSYRIIDIIACLKGEEEEK